jgi:PhzF family phenazine biosynthesis protein
MVVIEVPHSDNIRLYIVDVFSERMMSGNPAAIVLGAEYLEEEVLQRIARFMNLSETVFLLPSTVNGADFRARTFTVRREIPFSGHATLAAAHVYSETHDQPGKTTQECSAGLMPVRRRNGGPARYTVELPSPRSGSSHLTIESVAGCLGLPIEAFAAEHYFPIASAGAPWLLAEVSSANELSHIEVDYAAVTGLTRAVKAVGLVAYARTDDNTIRLRAFAPAEGILEDPVCGSCAGAIAAYICGADGPAEFRMEQGAEIGRTGVMSICIEKTPQGVKLRLEGICNTVITGELSMR